MDGKIVAIQVSTWLWDIYGKLIVDKTMGIAQKKWDEFNWKQAAEKYRQKMKTRYGIMHIFGMTEPVSLEGIYTDVFTLDKIAAFRRFDIQTFVDKTTNTENKKQKRQDKKKKGTHFHQPDINLDIKRKNAIEVINEKTKLFILGKPGAGKTTLLKFITLKASEGKINRIPIFISLKEWSDSAMDLQTFIVKQFEICSFPDANIFIETILNDGKAIILFDGLDEVNQENQQRVKLVTSIKNFIDQFDKNQFLITCRIAASDYSFESFTYVEIADFNDDQIKMFVSKWFSNNLAKKEKFLVEIEDRDNEGLKELASVPLLLTLLCLAFDETMAFPQRRVEIYEEATEALLKKWDTSRNIKRDDIYRKLSLGRKRQLLARLAAETFEDGEYFVQQDRLANKIIAYLTNLPPSDIGEDIDGEVVLKSLESQHGLLVERAWKIYSFSHLTFHEYFAAKYIADNANTEALLGLVSHMEDDRWREVLLLTASLLDNADNFFEIFIKNIRQKILQHEVFVALINSAELKSVSNNIPVDYPSRAKFLEQDVVNYINSKGTEKFSDIVQKHLRDISYARNCALELATRYKIHKSLLIVLSLDLLFLFELLSNETAKEQYGLQQLLSAEEDTNEDGAIEDNDGEDVDDVEETVKVIDFTFSKQDMDKMIKKEKDLLSQKDTSLTGCIGSLFAHAKILSRSLGLADIHKELLSINTPSAAKIESVIYNHELFALSLEVITRIKLNNFTSFLESNLLLCECLDLSYVADRKKIKNSLLLLE